MRPLAFVFIALCAWELSIAATNPPETLDGVEVDAVETYKNPRNLEVSVGAGLYPLDPYHLSFSLNGGFTYYFNSTWAWEVLSGSYAFSVRKSLTSQLADSFGVNPQVIEKLEYAAATSIVLVPRYGKAVLFRSFLQHFRTSFILGGGIVKTTQQSLPAISVGARTDIYISDAFSWRLELRDLIALRGGKNFLAFGLGTTISF